MERGYYAVSYGRMTTDFYDRLVIGTQGFHGGRPVGASPEVGGERVASVVRGERDTDAGKIVQEMGVGGGGDVLPW